jgi:sugar lactone lactonase YvrE
MKLLDRPTRWIPLALGLILLCANGASAQSPAGAGTPAPRPQLLPTDCPAGFPLPSGSIATVAGTGGVGSSGDGGNALAAALSPFYGMAAIDRSGAISIADGTAIRRIDAAGIITTVAGPATGAPFNQPTGLAFDAIGNLFVADFGANRIWRIDPAGTITPVAGNGTGGSTGNGGPALEAAIGLAQVAVGSGGDLYFDDSNAFRTVSPDGTINAFAGTGTAGFSGDGGPAVSAMLGDEVLGVAADAAGNVYLGDQGNHRIRKVDSAGIITTFAGTGVPGATGDGGLAAEATVEQPRSMTVDEPGNVYFADWGSNTVRRIDTAGTITTVAGTGVPGFSGDCGPAVAAQLYKPYGLAIRDGALYISDEGNHRIRVVIP